MIGVPFHKVVVIHEAHDIIGTHVTTSFVELSHLLLLLVLALVIDFFRLVLLGLLFNYVSNLFTNVGLINFHLLLGHEMSNFFLL